MAAAPAVLLVLQLVLVLSPAAVLAADSAAAGTTHLNFFMHDIVAGTSPTAVQVIKGPGSAASAAGMAFGDTMVIDDAITTTSSPTSAAVGRMQGFYMQSSQSGGYVFMVCANLLLTSGDYNGSTLAVMGRDDATAPMRELSVIGGTGQFRMATGYVLWKTTSMNGPDATIELNIYVTTAGGNGTTIDASAPVSPVAGGGSGSASGSGSKASSGAAYHGTGGWVSACVVAIVVAVVGSGVW